MMGTDMPGRLGVPKILGITILKVTAARHLLSELYLREDISASSQPNVGEKTCYVRRNPRLSFVHHTRRRGLPRGQKPHQSRNANGAEHQFANFPVNRCTPNCLNAADLFVMSHVRIVRLLPIQPVFVSSPDTKCVGGGVMLTLWYPESWLARGRPLS